MKLHASFWQSSFSLMKIKGMINASTLKVLLKDEAKNTGIK